MGWRLSFGFGPFRYSAPLRAYHGEVRDGKKVIWRCSRNHSRRDLAEACGRRRVRVFRMIEEGHASGRAELETVAA